MPNTTADCHGAIDQDDATEKSLYALHQDLSEASTSTQIYAAIEKEKRDRLVRETMDCLMVPQVEQLSSVGERHHRPQCRCMDFP